MLDDQYQDAIIKVRADIFGRGLLKLRLLDADHNEVGSSQAATDDDAEQTLELSLPLSRPRKWTAETPYLYNLLLSLDDKQTVCIRVGVRKVELKDGLIQVNGNRVVFKGANRHEHHPESGRTVPLEYLRHDLALMKQHSRTLRSESIRNNPADTSGRHQRNQNMPSTKVSYA